MAIKRKRIDLLGEQESLNYDIQLTSPKKHVKSSTPRAASSRSSRKLIEEITVPERDLKTPKQKKARRRLLSNEAITTDKERFESFFKEGSSQCGEHFKEIGTSVQTPKRSKVVVEIAISRSSIRAPSTHSEQLTPNSSMYDAYNSPSPKFQSHSPSVISMEHRGDPSQRLLFCLNEQKKEILRILQTGISSTEGIAHKQLSELIQGSVMRGEGNSCLVLGPRGSGKSRIVESCLDSLSSKPIILRLSGWVQNTDKHALREIATQLLLKTGTSLFMDSDASPTPADDIVNPFLDPPGVAHQTLAEPMRLPPSSQLHVLIPMLLTLNRPVIVVLDAFDLFALHPRQSLLYCLFDAVQSCRATPENRGITVIGLTSRIDTINLLEKRVKSRFSGRIFRTGPPDDAQDWLGIAKSILLVPITHKKQKVAEQWNQSWTTSVDEFLSDSNAMKIFKQTFDISRDVQVLQRLLTFSILRLNPSQPKLTYKILAASVDSQRARERYTHLNNLSYPTICLLIASVRADVAGHQTFTFEMLFEKFRDQLRASTSAPIQLNGGHIGMVKCTREVLMAAFDNLVSSKIFISTIIPSTNMTMEFIKHRSAVERDVIQKIVERTGHIHLKKWFNKG